jgi:hypothetical protein
MVVIPSAKTREQRVFGYHMNPCAYKKSLSDMMAGGLFVKNANTPA